MRTVIFFLRLLIWFILRQWRFQPWRILAVLVGIALGAAVFTSVRLAVDASLDSFTRSMNYISGSAEWTVTKPGGRIPEDLVARLSAHPAVETASPLLISYVSLSRESGESFMLIGLDPVSAYPLRQWQIEAPQQEAGQIWLNLIGDPGTLLPGSRLAQKGSFEAGDLVYLEHVNRIAPFRVLGTLKQDGLALVEGGMVAITDIASMQEFTGTSGWVDRIDLRLTPKSTEKDITALRALLPAGVTLEAPTEAAQTGRSMIHAYELNLSVLSFVSLFVGMFLVYSLVSLNAASRRRELATLRSLGADSRLIFLLILSEGLLLGIFGWLLAIPVGSFLVRYLLEGVSSTISNLFVRVRVETLQLDIWEIQLSVLVTLFVSSLAALSPALEAAGITPREAMVKHESGDRQARSSRYLTPLGILLVLLSYPVAGLPALFGFPIAGYLAICLLVAGFALLSRPCLRWMGSYLPSFLRSLAREPAFLAGRYVRDAGSRTAISVGALMTAMALFTALVIMIHSFRQTVTLWVEQTVAGDFFIRPKMAGLNRYQDSLPADVVEAVKQIEGVEIAPYRHLYLREDGIPYQLEAVDFGLLLQKMNFMLLKGDLAEMKEALISGQGVLVSEVFSNQTGLGIGDRYKVGLGEVILDSPILGVFRDYRTQGGIVYMDLHGFQRLTGDLQWSGARLFFKNRMQDPTAALDRLRSQLIRCCAQNHPLDMASGFELRREILEIFDQTFAVTTILLFIALLVAGLGITTTLTMLVLERIRQLNTLVAVGAEFKQIRSMIFWEAVLMVSAGEGIGLVCGFFLSYILVFVINRQSFGWTFFYSVDWGQLVTAVPLIMLAALFAALPAARLVVRSSPAQALKEP
jgi:putative ABC transport system permease protein